MKVTFKVTEKMAVELDGVDQKSLFEELSTVQEIFSHTKCGKCGNSDIRYVVRTVEDNKYYELHCAGCRARLAFGSHKKGGTLFPKRKDKDGNWLPDKRQ